MKLKKELQYKISAPKKGQNRDMNKVLCGPTEGENNLFCEISNSINRPLFLFKKIIYISQVFIT